MTLAEFQQAQRLAFLAGFSLGQLTSGPKIPEEYERVAMEKMFKAVFVPDSLANKAADTYIQLTLQAYADPAAEVK